MTVNTQCYLLLIAPATQQLLSSGQTVRVATPSSTAILKTVQGSQMTQLTQVQGAGKQIITVKTGAGPGQVTSSQPQIVTLVKTTQGMQVIQTI